MRLAPDYDALDVANKVQYALGDSLHLVDSLPFCTKKRSFMTLQSPRKNVAYLARVEPTTSCQMCIQLSH